MQSVMLVFSYFRLSFVNCCPSNLLSGSPLPPLPIPYINKYTIHMYTVCKGPKGGGYGVLGIKTDNNTCRKVPLHVNFLIFLDDDILTFCIAFYESYLSTVHYIVSIR
jgi:hypothetical protein